MENLLSKRNKEAIRKLYEDILNPRQLHLLNGMIADEYTGVRGEKGLAGFSETVGSLIASFPDIQWRVEDLVAEEEKVVVRWSWKGTHKNQFRGMAASNAQVSDNAIAIYQFKDEKIIQAWIQSDRLGFLTQIGIIPPQLLPSPQPPIPSSQASSPSAQATIPSPQASISSSQSSISSPQSSIPSTGNPDNK